MTLPKYERLLSCYERNGYISRFRLEPAPLLLPEIIGAGVFSEILLYAALPEQTWCVDLEWM